MHLGTLQEINEINFGWESSPIQTNCPIVLTEENYSGVG